MAIEDQAAPQAAASGQADTPRGAVITMAYVGREMKVYAIFDTEATSLALFNGLSTIAFSLGSFMLALAGGIYIAAAFAESLSPAGKVLQNAGAPLLIVLAVVAFIFGVWATLTHRARWRDIITKTKVETRS